MTGGEWIAEKGSGFELEEGGEFAVTLTITATTPAVTAAVLKISETESGAAILTATSSGGSPTITITNNANNYVLTILVPATTTDALTTTKRRLFYDLEVTEAARTRKVLYGSLPYRREPT
jgi:hypothetical protein